MYRGRRVVVLVVAAAAVVGALAVWPPGRGERLNVLLITLDTLRADRLGCYGYSAARTPALDGFAGQGLRFTQAFTHVPLTLPSHASILTGLHPPEHGLRDNARGKLSASTTTLAGLLRGDDYATGAFVASFVLDGQFGLGPGFELYDDRMTANLSSGEVFKRENRANVVADRALEWLRGQADRPFFCWVHFYDPHEPYDPPEPYRSRLADAYDGEIAFMDSQVKRLLDFLDARKLAARTLVVIVGDHGESFGEHKEFGHGVFLYDTTMHVPLLIRLPGRIEPGTSDRLTGLADVAPTVLGLLGLPAPSEMSGADALSGSDESGAVYGESEFAFNTHSWSPLASLTTRRWKYIEAPVRELYDRVADPGETKNLVRDRLDIGKQLAAQLARVQSGFEAGTPEPVRLDPEAVAKLRELGYLGGPTAPRERPSDLAELKDPKAMVEVFNACVTAKRLLAARRFREAAERLEPLAERSPESLALHEALAAAYLGLRAYAKAEPRIEACLALDPTNRPMVANLGEVFFETRRFDDAARTLRHALRLPESARITKTASGVSALTLKIRVHLGLALAGQGEMDDAIAQYKMVLKEEPGHLEANNNLAKAYLKTNKRALAARHLRRVVKAAPHLVEPCRTLGVLLYEARHYAEAVGVWQAGLKHHPKDAALLHHAAWSLATCPEPAVRDGKQAVALAGRLNEELGGRNAQALDTLAAAYAESGEFAEAVRTARRAIEVAKAFAGGAVFAKQVERRLTLYRASTPYREP